MHIPHRITPTLLTNPAVNAGQQLAIVGDSLAGTTPTHQLRLGVPHKHRLQHLATHILVNRHRTEPMDQKQLRSHHRNYPILLLRNVLSEQAQRMSRQRCKQRNLPEVQQQLLSVIPFSYQGSTHKCTRPVLRGRGAFGHILWSRQGCLNFNKQRMR